MTTTLLRLGLWIVLSVVALYVLHDTYEGTPVGEYFSPPMMQKMLGLGSLLLLIGGGEKLFEKLKEGPKLSGRCLVCRIAIPSTAIYCRPHLQDVIARESERTNMTRTRGQ